MPDPVPRPRIVYTPTSEEQIGKANVVKGRAYARRKPPYLAYDETGFFVHGNSVTRVMQGETDLSANTPTWRWWRVSTIRPAEAAPHVILRKMAWENDNLSGTPNWNDVPGQMLPASAAREPLLLEFVIRIGSDLSLPGVYAFVVVEMTDMQYRIRMSGPKEVTRGDWDRIKLSPTQWDGCKGMQIVLDSDWLLFPAELQQ